MGDPWPQSAPQHQLFLSAAPLKTISPTHCPWNQRQKARNIMPGSRQSPQLLPGNLKRDPSQSQPCRPSSPPSPAPRPCWASAPTASRVLLFGTVEPPRHCHLSMPLPSPKSSASSVSVFLYAREQQGFISQLRLSAPGEALRGASGAGGDRAAEFQYWAPETAEKVREGQQELVSPRSELQGVSITQSKAHPTSLHLSHLLWSLTPSLWPKCLWLPWFHGP